VPFFRRDARVHAGARSLPLSGMQHALALVVHHRDRSNPPACRRDPVQFRLVFRDAAKKDSVERTSVAIVPLFPSPSGIITEVANDLAISKT
jgi:hypothetical protein